MSPETGGLFHRAIIMSGSAQSIWANTEDVVHYSRFLTKKLGCEKVKNMKKCLQKPTTHEIIKTAKSFVSFFS